MPVLRSAFIALSKNRPLRSFCENTRFGRKMSSRFVAGMEIGDALRVTQALNQQGMHVTLDSLGESVSSEVEAHRAAEIYHQLLDLIANAKLNANISVKLTQMGLELSPELAEEIAESLSEHAAALGNFVRIDMEDSTLTQVTLDIVRPPARQGRFARVHRDRDPGLPLSVARRISSNCLPMGFACGFARAPTKSLRKWLFRPKPTWIRITSA